MEVMTDECPLDPGHGRGFVQLRPLSVKVRSSNPADFLHSTIGEWLCNGRVQDAFEDAKLSGCTFGTAEVFYPRQKQPDTESYAELCIAGWGGIAAPGSGIELIKHCPGCDRQEYRIPYVERLIDASAWDGSDFFIVWPLTQFVFCSEAAHNVIAANKLTGVDLLPADELSLGDGRCAPAVNFELSSEKRREIRDRFGI